MVEEKIFIDLIGRDYATKMFKQLGIEIDKATGKLRDIKTGQFVSPKDIKRMKDFNKELKKQKKSGFESFSVMLPLMFGFQQLGKAIESILKPADDLLGTQEIYNQFLAMKMLPAAEEQLDSVLGLGERWDELSEDEKLAQGRTYLLGKKMTNLGSYVVQNAMSFGALGEAIPFVGRAMGTIGGIAFSLGTGLVALADENYEVVAAMSDVGTAATMMGMDWLSTLQTYFPAINTKMKEVEVMNDDVKKSLNITENLPTIQTALSNFWNDVNNSAAIALENMKKNWTNFETAVTTGVTNLSNLIFPKKEAYIPGTAISGLTTTTQQVIDFAQLLQGPKGKEIASHISQLMVNMGYSYAQASDMVLSDYARRMQYGGIITRPTTALLGERGPEAVIPLDRIGSIGGINVTINTATIGGNVDMLAREIAEKFAFELSRVRY